MSILDWDRSQGESNPLTSLKIELRIEEINEVVVQGLRVMLSHVFHEHQAEVNFI